MRAGFPKAGDILRLTTLCRSNQGTGLELERRKGSRLRLQRSVKRALDLFLVVPGTVLVSPLLVVLTGLVRLTLGRPVFFRQQRTGLLGKPFTLLKFRTMNNRRDSTGTLLPDGERLSGIGRFLRRTSLDELPTLINVIKGDMSLVGPRPLITDYLDRYSPEQMRRHLVKPGITGWNQVNGRNALSWEEKFAQDVWYVDNWSLWLDLRILARTLGKVLRGHGVSPPGTATMPEFLGRGRR
jgi:sugar transferase EpsL